VEGRDAGHGELQVTSFQYLRAGTDTALLRLEGSWAGEGPATPPPLLVGEPGRARSFSPLPGPTAPGALRDRPWRVGFGVPLEALLEPGARFRLAVADGELMELPPPTEQGTREAAQATEGGPKHERRGARLRRLVAPRPAPPSAARRATRPRARRRLKRLREELAAARAELDSERSRSTAVDEEMRGEIARLREQLALAADELEQERAVRAELERSLRDEGVRGVQLEELRKELSREAKRAAKLESYAVRMRDELAAAPSVPPATSGGVSPDLLERLRAEAHCGEEYAEQLERGLSELLESLSRS
jgi:hypothetical protein